MCVDVCMRFEFKVPAEARGLDQSPWSKVPGGGGCELPEVRALNLGAVSQSPHRGCFKN